jgi:poly(ADP-ribose) glycohydrolase
VFFCTFADDAHEGDFAIDAFNDLSCSTLLARSAPQEVAKVQMLLHFFARATALPPSGVVTYARQTAGPEWARLATWAALSAPLAALTVHETGGISSAPFPYAHVDFANEVLGGGVLSGGCVQEEIAFAEHPLAIPALLLCSSMAEGDALVLSGCERFSLARGYALGLEFGGDYVDSRPRDAAGTVRRRVNTGFLLHAFTVHST